MEFFKRSRHSNYDLLSSYSWAVPGIGGMFILVGWLLVGALIGNIAALGMVKLFGPDAGSEYSMLISYPLMFIPAMIYTSTQSLRMRYMDEPGYAMDNAHFGHLHVLVIMLLCIAATLAMSVALDPLNLVMPPMPEWLEEAMNAMTKGNFLLNFLSVSIMAPFFEEWLCRGMVLRGLLNFDRGDGQENRGMRPMWAIVISALFFAVIHLNPWQAIPAFLMGLLFGYVYYKTGSLKLTMLMHCTNNTFALVMAQTGIADNCSFFDLMPAPLYIVLVTACVLLIALFVNSLHKIAQRSPQGNCDPISEGPAA